MFLAGRIPHALRKQTIREFIKAGEDFADIVNDNDLFFPIASEKLDNNDVASVPSMWLLEDILPVINPTVLDSE